MCIQSFVTTNSNWKEPIEKAIFGNPSQDVEPLLKLKERSILVCIGLESGLSKDEKVKLKNAENKAILRTDTAAISAAAIVNAMCLQK